MPPERTSKTSRHTPTDGSQLLWIESSSPSNIALAPNITPGTFNDPPPMVDPPCESILFPPLADSSSPRRPGHSKKKPENHIPRPPNAFILFRSSFIKSQHVSTEVETNHSTLSKIIGLTWQNLPHDERQVWHAKAKAALEEHKRKFPQYAFRPSHTKGRGPEKRKVREVGPKDLKRCAKIAELLVKGKKGPELDAAIQEFDRHHVPEVVTRFETPLTARQYRRSSSAPIPEQQEPFLCSSSSTSSNRPRRVRASSSQPMSFPSSPLPLPQPQQEQHPLDVQLDHIAPFYPEASPIPPSSTYSFSATPESSSFDFPSFSFDTTSGLPCSSPPADSPDALAAMYPHNPTHSSPPSLSIDTSFMDDWTRSSSPLSVSTVSMPATPDSYCYSESHGTSDACGGSGASTPCVQSPAESCGDHYTSAFGFDTFDQVAGGMSKSFVDLATLQYHDDESSAHHNPNTHASTAIEHQCSPIPSFHLPPAFGDHLSNTGNEFSSGYSSALAGSGIKPADHLELDFAAFMHSLPQYQI